MEFNASIIGRLNKDKVREEFPEDKDLLKLLESEKIYEIRKTSSKIKYDDPGKIEATYYACLETGSIR